MRFGFAVALASMTVALMVPDKTYADSWTDSYVRSPFQASQARSSGAASGRSALGGPALAKAAPKRSATSAPPARPGFGTEYGIASYYWQPQRVASGGWFNPNAMTAAHKTLPFGTRVRVTHLGNGRSVEVTINDRGPYIAGRIIDLSKAAAGVIGLQAQGIAQVRMDVLGR